MALGFTGNGAGSVYVLTARVLVRIESGRITETVQFAGDDFHLDNENLRELNYVNALEFWAQARRLEGSGLVGSLKSE